MPNGRGPVEPALPGWNAPVVPETVQEDVLTRKRRSHKVREQEFRAAAADDANTNLHDFLNTIKDDHSPLADSTRMRRAYTVARFADFVAQSETWKDYVGREFVAERLAGMNVPFANHHVRSSLIVSTIDRVNAFIALSVQTSDSLKNKGERMGASSLRTIQSDMFGSVRPFNLNGCLMTDRY